MQLNAVEKLLMNNPLRAALQRHYEARLLELLGGRVEGGHVLEIGCGRGVGAEIILDRFRASSVVAFDLDPDMVSRARRRLARFGDRVRVGVGDAAAINAPAEAFDAVFDFGVVHHVPRWRTVVGEVARVLRPGGRFFFEDVTRHALDRRAYRIFLEHPQGDRFTAAQFLRRLRLRRRNEGGVTGVTAGGRPAERRGLGGRYAGLRRMLRSQISPIPADGCRL